MPTKNKSRPRKSQASPKQKLIVQSRKQAKQQLTEQWRFLRRIGAYQTKDSPAEKRMTDSRARTIKKKFAEIQSQGKYKKGRTVRPIQYGERFTRSGKKVIDYHFSPEFEFIRTKHKPTAIEGVRKVGKGYVIEKTRPGTKLTVNKKGDIVETHGKERRTRKRMRGRDLLLFVEKIDTGQIKFRKHDVIQLHSWGAPGYQTFDTEQNGAQFARYISNLQNTMTEDTFDRYARATHVEIIREILD